MAAPINIPVNVQLQNVSQLQRQIQQATQNIRINLVNGNSARSLTALSQPLGRLTGQADEFTKSMDAANARVLAFGASVGVVNAFTNAFKSLIASTIEVEKAIKAITVVGDQFAGSTKELGQGLFNVAKLTGQSFAEVSKAALEFSRQGLKLEDTLQRTKDALILTRLTGLDSAKAVDGLTAAFNAFSKAGISTSQILNKLAAVDQAFAVSSADLIEGFNRSAAVAQNAGVTFDELAGIITALQQETSRGGAVIGNALKTIFTRLQDSSTLKQLDNLGIAVQDLQGNILPARQILQNLAKDVEGLGQITKAGIFKDVAGTFQINQLISLVGDLNKQNSIAADATKKSAGATNEAYTANEKLNQSLDAILNKVAISGKQIGSILGNLGITDNLKGLLDGLNSFLEYASETLQGDSIGAKFAQGIVKGIGSVLTGPGVTVFLAIITKLSYDLIKFGAQGLKTFFNIGQAAKQQQQIQESIVQTLLRNQSVLSQIVNTQGGQNAQAQAFLNILRQEEQTLQNIRTLAGGIAAPVIAAGYTTGSQGLRRRSAGGYLPAQEAADVRRGVGGASPNSKVVAIPNFAFGGGKRGTMIANTSEYIVPNYAGGGSAIFNQDMAKTMGLPPGAKKISAAGGFIPNFSDNTNAQDPKNVSGKYALLVNDLENPRLGETVSYKPKDGDRVYYKANIYGVQGTKNLTSAEQLNRFRSEFSTEALTAKYEKLALEDIGKYSNAVVGEPISPVAATKLANKGSVPSLVGSIFESAIISALSDADLINAQAERNPNAPFDFALAGKSKQFNKFFGIPQGIDYIEAKYSANSSTIESFASKIDRIESGKYVEKEKQPKKASGSTSVIRNEDDVLKALNRAGPFNFKIPSDFQNKISQASIAKLKAQGGIQTNAASGYIPNFASTALQAAISRERSAGVPASQIYIDKSPALQSSANPMGLMVANRRDEPAGGFQGISRARKEGRNPKTYGAANGFIPNFAPTTNNTNQTNIGETKATKGIGDLAGKFIVLQGALTFLQGGFTEVGSTAAKLNEGLQTLTAAFFAFSAIQQSQAKSSSELFKKLKSQSRKDLYRSGVSDRAVGRATGGISGRIQYAVGTAKRDVAVSTLGSLAGAAAASVVALKSFNDIAALFYTRSPQLDKSFELLSSASSKVASSLSDLDKATLKGAASGLKDVGIGGSITKFLSSLNPANIGRESVAYSAFGEVRNIQLKGGQTAEDFAKIQEDLSSLIFSNLKASFPNANQAELINETQVKIVDLFAEFTKNGVLDLEAVLNSSGIQNLLKQAEDTQTKLERVANQVAQDKPLAKLAASIESIIFETNKVFNEELNRLNSFSEKIKAVQASKAFSNLNLEQQLSVNLIGSSREFEKTFRERQIAIVKDAQKLVLDKLPKIVEGENFGIGQKLATDLQGAQTVDEVSFILGKFKTALEGIDPSKIPEFTTALSEADNNIETFKSNLKTSADILNLQTQELIATAQAEIEFRDKFLNFSNSVGETERSLIKFRGQLERMDIQRESNIAIRSSFATSRQQVLDIRREETLGGLSEKAGAEANIALQEALNEARKQSFTKENFVALNSNTEAIKTLTQAILQEEQDSLTSKIQALDKKIAEYANYLLKYGTTFTKKTAKEEALRSKFGGINSPTLGEQREALVNRRNLSQAQLSINNPIQPSDVSKISEEIFGPTSNIGQLAKESASLQDFVAKTAEQFKLSEQAALLFQPQLINIYNSLKSQAATAAEQALTAKARLDAEQNLLNATNNYRATLSATATDIETRLATQPMSQGEFLRARAEQRVTNRELNMTDEQVREDRSSFRRGFEDSMTEIEAKTADFRNEIGREIPQLFSSNLAQGLNDAISGAKSLKDALRDAATSFLNAITQKNIENLANMFTSGIGGAVRSTGFFASGGMISGGSGTKDDVPAMLMGGEYVIKKSAVKKYGSRFLDSLNNGGVQAFAAGGAVQSGKGGFYVPGDFGTGAITGKNQLLEFAGQSFTGGQYDRMGGFGMSGASISLEPESARLTAYGRENSPIFERVQQAKEEAFNVYLDQLKQESAYQEQLKQMEEAEKARKKQLKRAIISAVASTALSYIGSSLSAGGSNALGAATQEAAANNQTLSLGSKFTTYLGGAFGKGGATGTGGLGNVLSGNFGKATVNFGTIGKNYGAKPNYIFSGGSLRGVNYGSVSLPGSSMGGRSSNSGFSFGSLFGLGKRDYSSGVFEYGDYSYNPSMGAYGRRKRASGGFISGGSGIRDDIPTMLTGGEFVLNNRATRKLGVQNLNRLNAGATESQQSSGGVSDALISKLDELIQTTRESSKDNVVVNVSGMETGGEKRSDENKSSNDRELQRKIKEAVLAVIAQEKRLGGSLNK